MKDNCRTFPNFAIKPHIGVAVFLDLCAFHPECDCMANIYAHPMDENDVQVNFTPCEEDGEVHDQVVLESFLRDRWDRINDCAQGFAIAHEGSDCGDDEVVN